MRVQDLREGPGREAEWGAGLSGPEDRAGQGPGRRFCAATVSVEAMRPAACQLVLLLLEPASRTFHNSWSSQLY